MQENYLAKWLNNELTDAELKEFKQSEAYATYKKIMDSSERIEAPDYNVEEAWAQLGERRAQKQPKVVSITPFKSFLRIAAAVAVLLAGSYFYLNTLDATITTQYAESKEIVLPDSSEVILNSDSHLSYNEKNWDEERNISLKGEAFFKVAKGKKFTVSTDQGAVSVLGTQFNVENRKGFFEATCYEGIVSVTYNGKEIKLHAGNSFLSVNGKITQSKVAVNTTPSWLNNESTFKSIPLSYVFDEFERQHNTTIETKNIDTAQLFTGTFSNTDKELALRSISVPLQIKFKLEGNKVLFYGESAP
ncbi:FecR family protein [Maribacter sp. MJ134]|uniref:FecR family protein n=1 Tax=Maribacter sp. MJ134 TaxID=2496865 RepID=UPI000F83B9E0|nr:FecR family protein [Maribacter sp. MJ134]AZQ58942.1 FecR family protein [Maribacter sp. MJ134]